MWKITFYIVILVFTIYQFMVTQFLHSTQYENRNIKQAFNLSTRVLKICIENSKENFTEISKNKMDDPINPVTVDKDLLLKEFYSLLYENSLNDSNYNKIKSNILLKVLIYYDKFYVADKNDMWSIPYYFTFKSGTELIYLNTKNDMVGYYDASLVKKYDRDISYYSITQKQKFDFIIDKINSIVQQNTYEKGIRDKGLQVQILNPANTDPTYLSKNSYFNALNGITFMVVYAENKSIAIDSKDFKYNLYNVTGYTLDFGN